MNYEALEYSESDGSIPDKTLKGWIKVSYDLVVKSLPKRERESFWKAKDYISKFRGDEP